MENNTNLKENLQDFIEERLNESYANIEHSKEYKEISNRNAILMESIKNKTKNDDLIEEYQKTEYDLYTIQLQQAYLTGFKDSNIIFNNLIILE